MAKVMNVLLLARFSALVKQGSWTEVTNAIKILISGQLEEKHFVCRIKKSTKKTVVQTNSIDVDSTVFYDAIVLLGTPNVNQTKEPVRLVGYRADGKEYWVATDRNDLTAEEIAYIYKLRWNIENILRLVEAPP